MKMTKKWSRRFFAVALGMTIVGAPLFAVHAEGNATFTRDGQQYDVRRGMYEQEGGSDEHVRLGRYADSEHRQAREEERCEDQKKRQAEERCEEEAKAEAQREAHKEGNESQHEKREYRYDVRRGMYEQEGSSDTEVRRGMYEQPSEDGERRSLTR